MAPAQLVSSTPPGSATSLAVGAAVDGQSVQAPLAALSFAIRQSLSTRETVTSALAESALAEASPEGELLRGEAGLEHAQRMTSLRDGEGRRLKRKGWLQP